MLLRQFLRLVCFVLPLLALPACLEVRDSEKSPMNRGTERAAGGYGFRIDPVQFAAADRGLQGALVRTVVLKRPLPADQGVIDKRIVDLLKYQRPDGSFGRGPAGDASETNNQVLELLDLGVSPDRPELKRAVEWALGRPRADQEIANHLYFTQALCQLGQGSLPRVRASLRWLADHPDEWIAKGCPWTPAMAIKTLWAGREIEKSDAAVAKGLAWIAGNLNDAGCLGYWEPFGMLDCAGRVDHPQGRRIVERQIPMILRAQRPDGGWGGKSFVVFRALVRYGLLDALRKLPPLPPDWRVVRSIPAPAGELGSMAWDGQRLWVHDRKGNQAIAVSPEDGRVLKTIKLPDGETCGIGAWDGALAALQRKPKRVLQLDPETGAIRKDISLEKMVAPIAVAQVDGKLWVSDGWLFPGCVIDPARPAIEEPGPGTGRLERYLAGPLPLGFAPTESGVWHAEFWAPVLILSGANGRLLNWGEKPFRGAVGGIAWDGKQLWALDAKGKRLCVIERAATSRGAGPMAANVRREGGKVWAEGVPDLEVGDRWDMCLRGIEVLLQHRGEKTTLDELMALSGDAFNLCYATHWQGTAYMCIPTDPLANVAQAFGYQHRWLQSKMRQPKDVTRRATEGVLAWIWAEIDRGRPVLVGGCADQGCASWSVVVGYDRARNEMAHVGIGKACRWTGIRGISFPCNAEEGLTDHWNGRARGTVVPSFVGGWLMNPAFLLGDKVRQPDRREVALAALRRAVEIFRAPEHRIGHWGGVTYSFGEKAHETWANELHELDYPADLKKPQPKGAYDWYEMRSINVMVDCILKGRGAAAAFCEGLGDVLPQAKAHLGAAARAYRQETAIAREAFAAFIPPVDGKDGVPVAWLSDEAKREAGVAAIRQMLGKERAAIAEIGNALAAEGVATKQGKEGRTVSARREGDRVWIEGLDKYRVIDPMFEGIRIILASRGEKHSPEYIQGLSGGAFRIGGICPCAPTCNNAMSPEALIRLLGYEAESLRLPGKGDELKAKIREVVARVTQEVDAGRAALVFHAFTNAEFDVVYGYDAAKKQFLGRGSYAGNDKPFAEADEGRMATCGHICDPLGAIVIGRKTGQLDARKAELAALQEAVRHARSQKNVDKLGGEKWVMLDGLACYDRWIRDFQKPDYKRSIGDAYCYGVYHSTHRAAAGFLREIAPKYPKCAEHLRRAADHFEAEANTLDQGEKLLWWNSPEGPDPRRNAAAAALLQKARDAYAAGIAEIEQALAAEAAATPAAGAKGDTGPKGAPQGAPGGSP